MVVVEGSPRFYGRLGFEYAAPLGIEMILPSWAPTEAAQVLRLASYHPSIEVGWCTPLRNGATAT